MKIFKRIIICFTIYLVLSISTIPFIDSIWIGELPILAVIQLPKIIPANIIRHCYAVRLAKTLAVSKGSFSPDYTAARPYALLIIYLVPLLIPAVCYAVFIKDKKQAGKYVLFLLLFSVLDFLCVLHFSDTPGLTIY